MSMLRERAARGSHVPALLLFSARTWKDVIFRDELFALEARNDGFQLALTLTASPRAGLKTSGAASMPTWSPSLWPG